MDRWKSIMRSDCNSFDLNNNKISGYFYGNRRKKPTTMRKTLQVLHFEKKNEGNILEITYYMGFRVKLLKHMISINLNPTINLTLIIS